MPKDLNTNKPLKNLNFKHLIGAPLLACISAQEKAAIMSKDYIEEVGLKVGPDGYKEAVTVVFTFLQDGRIVDLNVPLLSLVPIPFFSIDVLEINFRASVKIDDGVISATYTAGTDSKGVETSKYNVESAVDVHVKATQDDMPSGLIKVLGFIGNNIRTYSNTIEFPEDADEELVKLICKLTKTEIVYTYLDDKKSIIDTKLTLVREAELMSLRKLVINHNNIDFRNINVLSMLPRLTELEILFDARRKPLFDFYAVTQIRVLKLTDIIYGKDDEKLDIDFSPLSHLRSLTLQHIHCLSNKRLNLCSNNDLEELILDSSPVDELDISECKNLRIIDFTHNSVINKLIVWHGFKKSNYNIRNCKIIEHSL